MEAKKLKTVEELFALQDERVELIDGDIVQRPMPRNEHSGVQFHLGVEVSPYRKTKDAFNGGWWFRDEVHVRYNIHQCPVHDLAGWRKERVPKLPKGVINITPDWVCEILSPGHEKKDLFNVFILLQNYQVCYYWVIDPEKRSLITYKLTSKSKYEVDYIFEGKEESDFQKVRIVPFQEIEIDLREVFLG